MEHKSVSLFQTPDKNEKPMTSDSSDKENTPEPLTPVSC